MKKAKSILCTILAAMLFILTMSGCANDQVSSEDGNEQVTLRWVLMGEKKQDSDKVWEAFNEKLQEKLPNTRVEFTVIPSSDYAEKWQLMMSAQETVDMAWNGWMQDWKEEVRRGSYMEISDLLDKYGENIKAAVPDFVWEDQMVDGKLYYIPNMQMMVGRRLHLFTSGDKADKYLDKERLNEAFIADVNAGLNRKGETVDAAWSDEIWDVIEDYLANLKAAGRLGLGFDPALLGWLSPVEAQHVVEPVCYVVQDSTGRYIAKAIHTPDSPYRKEFARMADFYQKGYIRKDIQTATSSSKDNSPEEGYVFRFSAGDQFSEQAKTLEAGEPIYAIDTSAGLLGYKRFGEPSDTNFTIPSTAKNPVRAMKLYNLLNSETDTELFNLLAYGLEGLNYKKVSENKIETFTPSTYSMYPWVIGNALNAWDTQTSVPGYNEFTKNVLNNPENLDKRESPFKNFKFDTSNIKGIMAQINSILGEYKDLDMGVSANWEERCTEMEQKLARVGVDKVVAELQRQLDETVNK